MPGRPRQNLLRERTIRGFPLTHNIHGPTVSDGSQLFQQPPTKRIGGHERPLLWQRRKRIQRQWHACQHRMLKELRISTAPVRSLRCLHHDIRLLVTSRAMNKTPRKHHCQTKRDRRIHHNLSLITNTISCAQHARNLPARTTPERKLFVPAPLRRAHEHTQNGRSVAENQFRKCRPATPWQS